MRIFLVEDENLGYWLIEPYSQNMNKTLQLWVFLFCLMYFQSFQWAQYIWEVIDAMFSTVRWQHILLSKPCSHIFTDKEVFKDKSFSDNFKCQYNANFKALWAIYTRHEICCTIFPTSTTGNDLNVTNVITTGNLLRMISQGRYFQFFCKAQEKCIPNPAWTAVTLNKAQGK